MAVEADFAVEEAWRIARLADVAAGADDQLRRTLPGEVEAGEVVDVAGDHHRHADRSRPRAAACSVALIGTSTTAGPTLPTASAPDRPVRDDPGRPRGRVGLQRVELRGERRHRVRRRRSVVRARTVEHVERQSADIDHHGRRRGGTGQRRGGAVQQPEPALAAARAVLVVAAHQHPGRGGEQRLGGREEVRVPGRPVVAPGAAGAAGASGRAGGFAVVVVADVDHEIRVVTGRQPRHLRERPRAGVVAGLHGLALQAAAGVAEDHDPPRRLRQRQRMAADRCARRADWQHRLADGDREVRVGRRAPPHRPRRAVDNDGRAVGRRRDEARLGPAVGQLHPGALGDGARGRRLRLRASRESAEELRRQNRGERRHAGGKLDIAATHRSTVPGWRSPLLGPRGDAFQAKLGALPGADRRDERAQTDHRAPPRPQWEETRY